VLLLSNLEIINFDIPTFSKVLKAAGISKYDELKEISSITAQGFF